MSMLDSFFNKGFKATKCKTLLKLTIPRIKLLRNRRELQLKQMRKDIAKLLETGQEATARVRVEHIIREENMMAAQEIIELYCELISVRLPVIETQRECPLDLKEAISSVCFAAPRCADLPELLQVQMAFGTKYGREFVAASSELLPDCGVNRQLIELLSVRAPSAEKKLNLLKDIAEEHGLDWDPAASETELLKSHEDLLNGPYQFVSGSKAPLPEEKRVEINTTFVHDAGESHQSDYDPTLEMLAFPEVPKAVPTTNEASAREEVPPPSVPSAPAQETEGESLTAHNSKFENPTSSEHSQGDPNYTWVYQHSTGYENPIPTHQPSRVPDDDTLRSPQNTSSEVESPNEYVKQFVPFISAPSLSSNLSIGREARPTQSQPPPTGERETSVDLQDVILAAQRAAEGADRAAAAARSAASLAQLRVSELSSRRKSDESPDDISDNPFALDDPTVESTRTKMDRMSPRHQNSSGYEDGTTNFSRHQSNQIEDYQSPFDVSPLKFDHQAERLSSSSSLGDSKFDKEGGSLLHQSSQVEDYQSPFDVSPLKFDHQAERLSSSSSLGDSKFDKEGGSLQPEKVLSTDDDFYSSYPSLFKSGGHSFNETSHSNT